MSIDMKSLLMGKAMGGGSESDASFVNMGESGWISVSKVGSVCTVSFCSGVFCNTAAGNPIKFFVAGQTQGDDIVIPEGYRPNTQIPCVDSHNNLRMWINQDGTICCGTYINGGAQGALRFSATYLSDPRLPTPPITE